MIKMNRAKTWVWLLCAGVMAMGSIAAEAAATRSNHVSKASPGARTAAVASKAKASRVKGVKVVSGARSGGSRVVAVRSGRAVVAGGNRRSVVRVAAEPLRPSFGQLYGLHSTDDPLDLKSSVALVLDQDTNEILLNKNASAVLPIASITKLMTALVVAESHLSLDEPLTISQDDIDTEKGSRSRLEVGTQLSRGEMLHLALMSSENRAANALGRHYPGGMGAFVSAMNAKARSLGMADTRYVEPTGLSSQNQSSASDLATLVKTAYNFPLLRELSTSPEYQVAVGSRQLQYHTTNRLVRSPDWDIGLQKTGYISEAGQCLVMQARMAGRKLIMVLLDSAGKYSRIGDAERIRKWLTNSQPVSLVNGHRTAG